MSEMQRTKRKVLYMHTINGKPAGYDGQMISYATTGRYARKGIVLASSLQQIKAEQRASIKWRIKQGFTYDVGQYSYALVASSPEKAEL